MSKNQELKEELQEKLKDIAEEGISAETVSVRFECLKFAQAVRKENIENLWATRKSVPEEVTVEELIEDAEKIWEFLISN